MRVRVDSSVEDSNGTPWAGEVQVELKAQDGTTTSDRVMPAANGNLIAHVYAPLDLVGTKADISIWGSPDIAATRGANGPYLTAAEGSAAFHSVLIPSGPPDNGYTVDLMKSVIAPAPSVGSFAFSPPTYGGMTIGVGDGDASRWNSSGDLAWSWTETLASGTTQIALYSWSKVGFWDCTLYGFEGWPLSSGTVRRVSGTPELITVPPQNVVDVTVDATTYPSANRIVIVKPQDHQPDPSEPSGHATEFVETLEVSVSYGPLDLSGGLFTTRLSTVEDGCYVQLWLYDSTNATTPGSLAASQQLSSGTGLTIHTVTF
ncbi:MAG: hypothetical protein GY722_17535 [bacterium]|nr:hypothetical protein [bacterium]